LLLKPAGLFLVLIALLASPPVLAQSFSVKGLVGVARVPSNARDSLGETLGGFGSGMALVPGSWQGQGNRFTGKLAMLPDRGWNTQGTTDYRARLEYFDVALTPGFTLTYDKTRLLTDASGTVITGLDPVSAAPAAGGLPELPRAANGHVSLDSEAVALAPDSTIWVSDEYGPYIYHFDPSGKKIAAIRPPEAMIPRRQGMVNFSAGETVKGQPQSGRQNNQGLEGMSIAPRSGHLFAITQSALVQDLDAADAKASRRNVRLLEYDVRHKPVLIHEYAVQLPLYSDAKRSGVAAQSEMLALSDHQLFLLCRDSGGGFTAKRDASAYRIVNVIDTDGATDIAGKFDGATDSIAPGGILRPAINPVRLTPFLDINDNAQLARFRLHNGAPNDTNDLYEKWESMALAPAQDAKAPDDYFLFIGSDNDFITQDGMMAGKPYHDASGDDVDSLVLAYRVTLPTIDRR
jgi:hypothetical protein